MAYIIKYNNNKTYYLNKRFEWTKKPEDLDISIISNILIGNMAIQSYKEGYNFIITDIDKIN